jgi:vacuolar-type H+-ATPase subunit C/Vma6
VSGWTGLVARTRGRLTRLLPPESLESIERCVTLRQLSTRLAELEYLRPDSGEPALTVSEIELGCRRLAAAHVRVLERWTLGDADVLRPFTLAEDLRSIRAVVRGAVFGIDPDERLRGLIPTTALPVRALARLATLNDVPTIGTLLTTWRHPLAAAIAGGAATPNVDLWSIDRRLLDAWATSASRAGRALGAASLRRNVADTIDLANAVTARLLAEQRIDATPTELFVRGGRIIVEDDLVTASTARDTTTLAARLRDIPGEAALRAALSPDSLDIEGDILRARIQDERDHTRRDPLDLAIIALFFLELRAEQRTIIRAAWSCALADTATTTASSSTRRPAA